MNGVGGNVHSCTPTTTGDDDLINSSSLTDSHNYNCSDFDYIRTDVSVSV